MTGPELKRKLRRLRRIEERVKRKVAGWADHQPLLWYHYFSTTEGGGVKYPFEQVREFTHEQRKDAFEDYILRVYLHYMGRHGFSVGVLYDPELLAYFGLTPFSTPEEFKARFRELAHKHHPDKSGDPEEMKKLLRYYDRIFPKT